MAISSVDMQLRAKLEGVMDPSLATPGFGSARGYWPRAELLYSALVNGQFESRTHNTRVLRIRIRVASADIPQNIIDQIGGNPEVRENFVK